MSGDTRIQYLDAAESLFAEKGFYGVSIASVASQLPFTKQALLHHFSSKEKLYAEVLKRISHDFEQRVDAARSVGSDPRVQLKQFLLQLQASNPRDAIRSRLLMRELMDNKRRADSAGTWYLKSFLDTLVAMVLAVPGWHEANRAEALAMVYQLLGAVNYFANSGPTLTGILGRSEFNKLERVFPGRLEILIDATLDRPPR